MTVLKHLVTAKSFIYADAAATTAVVSVASIVTIRLF